TPGLKVKRSMIITKERRLPLLGEILVEEGDTVSYDTIVARTKVPGDPQLVKVSAVLGIDEDEVEAFLFKGVGDNVSKGEVLGRYRMFWGLINREVTSPIDGEIESISKFTGQMILRPEPIPVEVNAYIPGKIVEILPREGVVVETHAAFIQGILGLGGETHGELKVVVDSPEDELTPDMITEADRGHVLIGGSLITRAAVAKAIELGVSGLVAGGMNYTDVTDILGDAIGVAITGHEDLGTTLIITEGFGKMVMSNRTFQLLKRNEGKVAAINGATQIRAGVLRPEIIIPQSESLKEGSEDELSGGMTSGTPVRIIREPHFGAIGSVVRLPVELQEVESGSKVRVLVVELDDGTEVIIPRANVEIIQE
ncbi:MAG: hypothetical protein PVJ38_07570, partial [Candidatus Bathyarchaeota archaeon]